MTNFLLIAVCLTAGWLLKRNKLVPSDGYKTINAWLIYLALPAVSFKYLPKIVWSRDMILPAMAPVICLAGAWVFAKVYAKLFALSDELRAVVTITGGLANTSFVGFPLISAYFGERLISIAVICDQITFLLLSTVGVVIFLNAQSHHQLSAGQFIKKILVFPPLIATVLALILPHYVNLSILDPFFTQISSTVAPLALLSVGMQLNLNGWRSEWRFIGVVSLYKLLIAPLLILAVVLIAGFKGDVARISVFEMAMPTLLSSSIVADRYNVHPKLVSLIIGISILTGLASTGLWYFVISHLI